MEGTDLLITGGYGTVGRRVAADLAPDYPGRLVVAGRSAAKAGQLAAEIGYGARGRTIDVGDPASVEAALGGVGLVMSCIDQPEPQLLRAAIARGLAYTDIAPHLMTRRPTEAMKAEAAGTGARIVLGAGLAPGISSLLARMGADLVGAIESIEVGVLLSAGDAYGPASRNYLMEEIAMAYAVRIEGREVPMRPFSGSARVDFPPPLGERTAYPFPFSDQVFFPETLSARTAITRLVLDPPWLGTLLSALVRLRLTAGLRWRGGSQERVQRLIARLQRRYEGHDWYGVVVDVRGSRGRVRASLAGRGQASGTATGAAAVARASRGRGGAARDLAAGAGRPTGAVLRVLSGARARAEGRGASLLVPVRGLEVLACQRPIVSYGGHHLNYCRAGRLRVALFVQQ